MGEGDKKIEKAGKPDWRALVVPVVTAKRLDNTVQGCAEPWAMRTLVRLYPEGGCTIPLT